MGYWFLIAFISALLIVMIICVCFSVKKEEDKEKLPLYVLVICFVFAIDVFFCIDIPDALRGGQKLYVDKFPAVLPLMSIHIVYADEQQFLDFNGYNPDKYEQDAKYCISYTKFTKNILKIEKVE